MTILMFGGQGKTSRRLTELLRTANVSFIVASRSQPDSSSTGQVQFDWFNEATYLKPFDATNNGITAVYLVAPPNQSVVSPMKAFIDVARSRGVKRFVLLSASPIQAGGPVLGKVHEYIISLGVEYSVLRPTWFMENFSEQQHRVTTLKENRIYSATQDGKVPWVSADDIAQVAYRCLVDENSHDTDHVILGQELLSYDDIAAILSDVVERKIVHMKLTVPELAARYIASGMQEEYANILAGMDGGIARGSEEKLNNEVEKVTGKAPKDFRSFAKENRGKWLV